MSNQSMLAKAAKNPVTKGNPLTRSDKAKLLMEILKSPSGAGGLAGKSKTVSKDQSALLAEILKEFRQDLDQKSPDKNFQKPMKEMPSLRLQKKEQPSQTEPKKTVHGALSLQQEHPAISAIVLSGMPTGKAAALLKSMQARHAQRTALMLAKIESRRQVIPEKSRAVIERQIKS